MSRESGLFSPVALLTMPASSTPVRTVHVVTSLPRRTWVFCAVLLTAAAAGAVGFVSFAFGTCHDAGGFCADEFSSTHVEAYAGGVVFAAVAACCCAWAFRARRAVTSIAVVGIAALTALAAVLLEL